MIDTELALTSIHRLCKKAGAERVSDSAVKELAKTLDDIGVKIASEAIDYAVHAGRKTVKARDIQIAARKLTDR